MNLIDTLVELMVIPIPGIVLLLLVIPRLISSNARIWKIITILFAVILSVFIYAYYSEQIDIFSENISGSLSDYLYLLLALSTLAVASLSSKDIAVLKLIQTNKKTTFTVILAGVILYIYLFYTWVDISGIIYYQYRTTRTITGEPTFSSGDYRPDSGSVIKLVELGSFKPIREFTVGKDGRYLFRSIFVRYTDRLFAVVVYNHAKANASMSYEGLDFHSYHLRDLGVNRSADQDKISRQMYEIDDKIGLREQGLKKDQLIQLKKHHDELAKIYFRLWPENLRKYWGLDDNITRLIGGYQLDIEKGYNKIDFLNTDHCKHYCVVP